LSSVDDPLSQMRAFVALFLKYNIEHKKECFVFNMEMRSLTTRNYRIIATLHRDYHNRVRAIIKRGVLSGVFKVKDVEIATFAIIQVLSGVIRWHDPRGRLTLEELTDVYTAIALGALGVQLAARTSLGSKRSATVKANSKRLEGGRIVGLA